jgi:glycerophosphoryl diester phosphodiesterase
LKLDFVALSAMLAEPELLSSIRAAGKPVHVWTVNEVDQMQRIIDLGVDGIITDRPARLHGVLDGRFETEMVAD